MEGRHGSCAADFDLRRLTSGCCACKELGIARMSSTLLPGALDFWTTWFADDIDTKGAVLMALEDPEKCVGFLISADGLETGRTGELSEDCGFVGSDFLTLTGAADASIPLRERPPVADGRGTVLRFGCIFVGVSAEYKSSSSNELDGTDGEVPCGKGFLIKESSATWAWLVVIDSY